MLVAYINQIFARFLLLKTADEIGEFNPKFPG
jgi:hypothetical protein